MIIYNSTLLICYLIARLNVSQTLFNSKFYKLTFYFKDYFPSYLLIFKNTDRKHHNTSFFLY